MVFSNTLDGDYNSSPSDTWSASNALSASSSTVIDIETDNDAGRRATGRNVHELITKPIPTLTLIFTQSMDHTSIN